MNTAAFMAYNPSHEREQAQTLVDLLLRDGACVSVNDGEEWVLKRSTDRAAILAALGSTDNDSVRAYDASGAVLATFWLVYGNSPGELIADCTANAYAERICAAFETTHPLA